MVKSEGMIAKVLSAAESDDKCLSIVEGEKERTGCRNVEKEEWIKLPVERVKELQ